MVRSSQGAWKDISMGELLIESGLRVEGRVAAAASVLREVGRPAPGPTPKGGGAGVDASRGARLLVVDDVEENREVLRRFLGRHGYVVDGAAGGREALEMVGRQRYDLVLLDVMMPEVGGYDVLKGIRENH